MNKWFVLDLKIIYIFFLIHIIQSFVSLYHPHTHICMHFVDCNPYSLLITIVFFFSINIYWCCCLKLCCCCKTFFFLNAHNYRYMFSIVNVNLFPCLLLLTTAIHTHTHKHHYHQDQQVCIKTRVVFFLFQGVPWLIFRFFFLI